MSANLVEVKEDVGTGKGLVAKTFIAAGSVIGDLVGKKLPQANMHSIHTQLHEHTEVSSLIKYTSHACVPNSAFQFGSEPWKLVALKDISERQLITYDYETTEYISSDPFDCQCKTSGCRGQMKGFFYLDESVKEKFITDGKASPVIEALHKAEKEK